MKIVKWFARGARAAVPAILLMAGMSVSVGVPAQASTYPDRTITIVVPYPAGGSTDILARLFASHLNEALGQAVVVENRPGAGGQIGASAVARSAPDGYTLLVGITSLIQSLALYDNIPYDFFKDFAPISQLAWSSSVLVVPQSSPAKTLDDFVRAVKAKPGAYNYASFGNGTSPHLHGELLNMTGNLDMTHVPYKGAAPALRALVGGEVQAAFIDIGSVRELLNSNQLRPLGVTGEHRLPILPDTPTMVEAGFPGFEPYGWFGVFAPAGVPKPILDKLALEAQRFSERPDVQERFDAMGLKAVSNTPEQFAEILRTDAKKWADIVDRANITLD